MAFPDLTSDFTSILADAGVTVAYKKATNVIDPITGDNTPTFADAVDKTWIFYKTKTNVLVTETGSVNIGDASLFMPKADTVSIGDQIVYDSETFEITNDSMKVKRYMGAYNIFNHYVLFLVK